MEVVTRGAHADTGAAGAEMDADAATHRERRTGAGGSVLRLGPGFWSGVVEALLVPLAFTALGLLWWALAERAGPAAPPYAPPMRDAGAPGETWLIDGFNVVQVALLGGRDRSAWWSAAQRAELLSRAETFEDPHVSLFVVFDGERPATPGERAGRIQPVFAPCADDWMLDRVRGAEDPRAVVLVTADRRLAGRARHHGARVVSPGAFLARCRPPSGGSGTLDGQT